MSRYIALDLTEVRWKHPVHGDVIEIACPRHTRELLGALRVLGVGCAGTYADAAAAHCDRCQHRGERVASWIGTRR